MKAKRQTECILSESATGELGGEEKPGRNQGEELEPFEITHKRGYWELVPGTHARRCKRIVRKDGKWEGRGWLRTITNTNPRGLGWQSPH